MTLVEVARCLCLAGASIDAKNKEGVAAETCSLLVLGIDAKNKEGASLSRYALLVLGIDAGPGEAETARNLHKGQYFAQILSGK